MSEKKKSFQSKPRFGAKKFDKDQKERGGSGFGKRSEEGRGGSGGRFKEDRRSSFRSRDERSEGRSDRPRGRFKDDKRPSFDRDEGGFKSPRREKPRFKSDRDDSFRRDEGGFKSPRRERPRFNADREDSFERRPRGEKSFGFKGEGGERRNRQEGYGGRDGGRGKRSFGDDSSFKSKKSFRDKPRRDFGHAEDRKFDRNRNFERAERRPHNAEAAREKLKSTRPSYGTPSSAFLYGIHAVTEALLNPARQHQRLLCTENGHESLSGVLAKAAEKGLKIPTVTYVEKEDINRLLPRDAVHQDVLLDCQPLEEVFLTDMLNTLPEKATVLILDQVTDPHNVGAILRSAAAFGAAAVIVQKVHAPEVTGTLAKSASGALEHIPLIREVNLSRTLAKLKEEGFTRIGLAEAGRKTLTEMQPQGRVAFVLGAEGDGLRRLVSENCDELVRLPTKEDFSSLNVSNAAAIALYACAQK